MAVKKVVANVVKKKTPKTQFQKKSARRINVNEYRIDNIVKTIGIKDSGQREKLRLIIQGGKGLHTKASLKRTLQIKRQVKKGTFNLKRRIAKDPNFKDIKKSLGSDASIDDILAAIIEGDFYLENRELIMEHNENPDDIEIANELSNVYQTSKAKKIKVGELGGV